MPTFTAIALDSLLEPGHSKSMVTARNVPDPRIDKRSSAPPNSRYNDRRRSASSTKLDSKSSAPTIGLDQRNSNPAIPIDRQHHRTGISPALYATPQSTPLPDSPSSYPPSPYIINHKRRGPRLLKCMSHDDVAVHQCATDGKEVETSIDAEKHAPGKEDPKSDTSAEKNSVLNLDCSSASENGIRTSMAFDFSEIVRLAISLMIYQKMYSSLFSNPSLQKFPLTMSNSNQLLVMSLRLMAERFVNNLLPIGLTLPAVPVTVEEDIWHLDDAVKNMIEQLYVVGFSFLYRMFVSNNHMGGELCIWAKS
nr:uncharacterized protein LOC109177609 [Ipomoea batatas]